MSGRNYWRAEELSLLRELRPFCTYAEIALLIGRPEQSVKNRSLKMGSCRARGACVPWTEQETAVMRQLSYDLPDKVIGQLIGRSESAVLTRRLRVGPVKPDRAPWPAEDLMRLRDLWPISTTPEVALAMGRSHSSVKTQARRLGLTKHPAYLVSIGRAYLLYPPELHEVVHLRNQLRKVLKDAKHSDRSRPPSCGG